MRLTLRQPHLQNGRRARHCRGIMRRIFLPALTAAVLCAAAPALAGEHDRTFFVKRGGGAIAMLDDRDACIKIAEAISMGRGGEAYSDPDYGMISAMGAALESGALENGSGVGKAVRRAALEKCMEKRGWSQLNPSEADERAIRKASRKDPAALDAWLKANEPAMVQTVSSPASAAPAPAAAVPTPAAAQAAPSDAAAAAAAPAPVAPVPAAEAAAAPAPTAAGPATAAPSAAPSTADTSVTPPK